jgi:hypothetical protein
MNKHAQQLGRLGGKVKSEAKTNAVRKNGLLGGRPKLESSALCIHCSNSPCICSHYPDCNLNNYGSCDCERNYLELTLEK